MQLSRPSVCRSGADRRLNADLAAELSSGRPYGREKSLGLATAPRRRRSWERQAARACLGEKSSAAAPLHAPCERVGHPALQIVRLLHTWRIRSVRWRRWSSASSCWACRFSASSTVSAATESLSCCRRRSLTRESSAEPTRHNIRPLPHEPCCRRIIFKGEQGDKFYVIYEGVVAINDVYSDITLNRGVRTIWNCPPGVSQQTILTAVV